MDEHAAQKSGHEVKHFDFTPIFKFCDLSNYISVSEELAN